MPEALIHKKQETARQLKGCTSTPQSDTNAHFDSGLDTRSRSQDNRSEKQRATTRDASTTQSNTGCHGWNRLPNLTRSVPFRGERGQQTRPTKNQHRVERVGPATDTSVADGIIKEFSKEFSRRMLRKLGTWSVFLSQLIIVMFIIRQCAAWASITRATTEFYMKVLYASFSLERFVSDGIARTRFWSQLFSTPKNLRKCIFFHTRYVYTYNENVFFIVEISIENNAH